MSYKVLHRPAKPLHARGGDQRYGVRSTALELALMRSRQKNCSASVHGSRLTANARAFRPWPECHILQS